MQKKFPFIFFVIIGGIYVFSVDLGADKQRISNMEDNIKKVDKRTDNIDNRMNDIMKNLLDMKKENEGAK